MVKLTDQSIPSELVDLYNSLATNGPPLPGDKLNARSRKSARIAKRFRKNSLMAIRADAAAESICRRLGLEKDSSAWRSKRYEQAQAILSGSFDPRYWQECETITSLHFGSTPSSVSDPDPPPYGYRIPTNLPTITTYPAGSVESPPARYSGTRSGNYFEDTVLVWLESLFELVEATSSTPEDPLFFVWLPDVEIESTTRGSRPMLSVIVRADLAAPDSSVLFDHAAPVVDPISFYWRYILPDVTPPYYSLSASRRIVGFVPESATLDTDPIPTSALLKTSPRPMFGRGFNNNDDVSVSISNDAAPKLYQLKPCMDAPSKIISSDGNFHLLSYRAGTWETNTGTAGLRDISAVPSGILSYHTDGHFEIRNSKGALLQNWSPPWAGTTLKARLCPSGNRHLVFVERSSGGAHYESWVIAPNGQTIAGPTDISSFYCGWRYDWIFCTGPSFMRASLWPLGQVSFSDRFHEAQLVKNLPGALPGDLINKSAWFGKWAATIDGLFMIDTSNRLIFLAWPAPGSPVDCFYGAPPESSGGAIIATGLPSGAQIAPTPEGCYYYAGGASARLYDSAGSYETLPAPSPWYAFSPSATCMSPAYP